ncbi:hypothetical protein V2J09_008759 [Rumex salicifolius]
MNPEFPDTRTTRSPFFLDQMPEAPQRGSHHRRAHSETFFRFPDDLLFDADLSSLELPATTDAFSINSRAAATSANQLDAPMTFDSCKSEDSRSNSKNAAGRPPISHFRSWSVDASTDFFEGVTYCTPACDNGDNGGKSDVPSPSGGRKPGFHRRNKSIDGSSSSFEADSFVDGVKKVMTPDQLAELALIDPKRAKKILANRQSAARSKDRKVRYTGELEKKVQTLQIEATTLSTQVTMLQRDATGLTAENRELKLRLQALEQQAQLKDALNDTLKEEVQRLRIATGQLPSRNSNAPNRSSIPFDSQQIHPQPHMPQTSNNDQNSTKQLWPSFLDYKRMPSPNAMYLLRIDGGDEIPGCSGDEPVGEHSGETVEAGRVMGGDELDAGAGRTGDGEGDTGSGVDGAASANLSSGGGLSFYLPNPS